MADVLGPVPPRPDLWAGLRNATTARIGLGRSGNALPLKAVLDFQLAHAKARDAVHDPLDVAAVQKALAPLKTIAVASSAPDRPTYLRRPDLGRRLSEDGFTALDGAGTGFDLVFVVADGLSATAVQSHAAPLVQAATERLKGFSIAPVVVATQARVALGDDVGERLGARLVAVLIGERPGLSVADSLGVYLTFGPKRGRRDAERNCISNVHTHGGLSYALAADKLAWLATAALRLGLTGVKLKDDVDALAPPAAPAIGPSD
ncbi:ethanolamine ammonia-lyase subunit EutC [Methylopila sp. M107]|uniref:ethanolamine ammonia-lyase subunit EutC n=1 Tax=Methylopila sp. M107 TaxID=1101190 RepID=UPI0003616BA0|nr:ethanolamine ammonia-lyase subunit EutC [Methylopila sp. M107]